MKIKCILCMKKAGKYSQASHTSNNYKIYKCSDCGLEYTVPLPNNQNLIDFYSNYNDMRVSRKIAYENAKRNIDIIKQHTNIDDNSLLLDFGCGDGDFVEFYGENCYGVELSNKNSNKRIKKSIKELNIKEFDCITLFGVLEHLNNLRETMMEINSYLKKNGHLVITTVDAESLIPYFYKPPEHLTYWTSSSLNKLAELLDLEIIYNKPYIMIQSGDVYLNRLLSRTPEKLQKIILNNTLPFFPELVEVPTNEVFVIMKKTTLIQ